MRFAVVFVARMTATPLSEILALTMPQFKRWRDAAEAVQEQFGMGL